MGISNRAELTEAVARAAAPFLHGPEKYEGAEAVLAVVAQAMREPTLAMQEAGCAANDRYALEIAPCSSMRALDAWAAMLAASPLAEGKP